MHYTHHFPVIRRRKHALHLSLFIFALIYLLIFTYGFSQVNAKDFTIGFLLSLIRVLFAYLISVTLALVTALLVTARKNIEDTALPFLDMLQSFPAFSILPLLLAFLGSSNIAAITILTLEMIWPILFSILTGLKSQNEEVLEAATIFGAKGYKRVAYVTFPLILPALVTGSIVAWGEAWETVLAAEIIIKIPGVGTYLSEAGNNNQNSVLVIGILLLMIILFLLNKFFWIPLLNRSTEYQQ
jgi:NitT/TauT family transport system permease protein